VVYVFFANGLEEMEAVSPVDVMRRAGIEVITVGVGGTVITGSHGIALHADIDSGDIVLDDRLDAVVLPGGLPGTYNLRDSADVKKAIEFADKNGKIIAALCAAPTVLKGLGLLECRRATVNPSFREALGDSYAGGQVVRDGKIITGEAAGAAVPFGLALVEALTDGPTADGIRENICFK